MMVAGNGRREKVRILIVDDEPNIRAVLRRALPSSEYEITEAESGEEALRIFDGDTYDVVLSDLVMPGIGGTELLSRFKSVDPAVGFIILTGAASMENAIAALRLHADDYLLKPFNLDEVLLSVERAMYRRGLVLENRYYQQRLENRVEEQAEELEKIFVDALVCLATAIEARDDYTGGHVERVTRYAVATGLELGLSRDELRSLWVGALLHDVGKIGVPDEILKKPERLTEQEYRIMQRHPEIGAAILQRSEFLRAALPTVLHHQECWDGTGYPAELSGADISLGGRILSVVDTFDAIVSTRPYHGGRPEKVAIEEIRRCAGTQFDPQVVEAFLRAHGKGFPACDAVPVLPERSESPDPTSSIVATAPVGGWSAHVPGSLDPASEPG